MSAGATRRILLPIYPAYVRGQEKAVIGAAKSGQLIAGEMGKGQFLRNPKECCIYCTKVSPPQRGDAVPAPPSDGGDGPKWRGNFGYLHSVTPQSSGGFNL